MILINIYEKNLYIYFTYFLTSCAGDGSKIIPDTTIDNKNATSLFFYRTGGYVAGGVLVGLEVNELMRLQN